MCFNLGHKKTFLGEIPNEWNISELNNVLLKITNGITTKQFDQQTMYPVTRIETISEGIIDPKNVKYLKDIVDLDLDKYRLHEGDILFSHINSIKHISKTAIYNGNPPLLIHGMNLLLLRPNKNIINPKFLLYLLKYEKTRNKFRSMAKRAVNQASINQKEVGSVKIPIPPLVEQRGIAKVLSTVDEAIQRTDAVIAKAEELKQGLMQRLLTQGIGHTEFKQTELGEIPVTWKIEKLGNIFKLSSGKLRPKKISTIKDGHNKYPVYGANGILGYSSNYLVEKRVIVIGRVGACGSIYLTNGKSWISDNALYTNNFFIETNLEYLKYLLKLKRLNRLSKRSSHPLLTQKQIYNLKIALPPYKEQLNIVKIISTINTYIEQEINKKNKFEEVKRGLMQVLLTGKIRVRLDESGLRRIR